MRELNIERPDELLDYLRRNQRIRPDEIPAITTLPGGVSNRTVLVERSDGTAFVLKQALEKLRVQADWHSNPDRSHREALGLVWLERLAPPGTITPLLFEDRTHHLVAMAAVPRPHENWKTRLLAGGIDIGHVEQFAKLLGTIHRRSHEDPTELAHAFENRSYFESLRVEPYYRFAAVQNRSTEGFFRKLISDTEATREAIVHGDYSPKNILIYRNRLILLDHEVIHFGDPAFDVGFSLTHLLSKAHHCIDTRQEFLEVSRIYWKNYRETAGALAASAVFESRAARHTLGCLLARVDGRSPLEYLSLSERNRQRAVVVSMISSPPPSVAEVIDHFGKGLSS